MPGKDLQLPHRRPFSWPSRTHPQAFLAPSKNSSCHCFHPVPCIYPLFHFQHYLTVVLKVSASLSFTPLLEQPPYYEKLLTLSLTFSTGLRCCQTHQDRLGHRPGLHQLLDICKHFHQSYPSTVACPLALNEVPLVPLLQGSVSTHPSPKSRKQHTKLSHLTGSRHIGDRPSNPIYPTAELELHLG